MDREGVEEKKDKGGDQMSGYNISKKNLWLMAAGVVGALAVIGIGKASKRIRPAVVGAVKEGYGFKEWIQAKIEGAKEDIEDIVAEAKHVYYKDIEAAAESVKKEKEILQKVEEKVEKKMAKIKGKKEGK